MIQKENHVIYGYSFEATSKEADKVKEYYLAGAIEWDEGSFGPKMKYGPESRYEDFELVGGTNCTVALTGALNYGVDRFKNLDAHTPYSFEKVLKTKTMGQNFINHGGKKYEISNPFLNYRSVD